MTFPNPFRFFAAVRRVVSSWFARRPILVTEEVEQARQRICDACEEQEDGQCKVCSCFLVLKINLADEECPKKKWLRAR